MMQVLNQKKLQMAKKSKAKKRKSKNKYFFIIICSVILIFGGAVYWASGYIVDLFWTGVEIATKVSGFAIETLDVKLTQPEKTAGYNIGDDYVLRIRNNLGVKEGDSIFKCSSKEIYENLMKDSMILTATVKKQLPNMIRVKVTTKSPIAIFQHNERLVLIDANGSFIKEITNKYPNLPLIVGDDANMCAKYILETISQFELINKSLETLIFVRKRRWDIVVNGIKVKLPEYGLEKALENLTILMRQENINSKTVKFIDFRSLGNAIINGARPNKKAGKRIKV
jgi:cell division protein FtsQ